MANLIETIDIQRAIRAAAFKKAAQLYNAKNMQRWGISKPNDNQIRGIFRLGYAALRAKHKKTKWMQDKYKPTWISRLDYFAARGGKPIMEELLEIIKNLGGIPMDMIKPIRITKIFTQKPDNIPLPDSINDYN